MSARFTSFVHKIGGGGKRDGAITPPKDDKESGKEIAEAHAEPAAVSAEAPKLDKHVPAEPLKIDEVSP